MWPACCGTAVEQQLREAADLTYVQFKVLARLGLDSPTGSLRMTDWRTRWSTAAAA